MFEFLIKKLKAHPRRIVFTEGTDPRILEASARLLSGTFLTPVLVGRPDEVFAAAEEAGFNIRGAEIVDPEAFEDMDKMVSAMVELRKGKMTEDQCRAMLKQGNYFGTMLVKMGYADAKLNSVQTLQTVRQRFPQGGYYAKNHKLHHRPSAASPRRLRFPPGSCRRHCHHYL